MLDDQHAVGVVGVVGGATVGVGGATVGVGGVPDGWAWAALATLNAAAVMATAMTRTVPMVTRIARPPARIRPARYSSSYRYTTPTPFAE